MMDRYLLIAGAALALLAVPVVANVALSDEANAVTGGGGGANLPPYLHCGP